ncbi:ERAD-associated E3 ubiquitin-protein ligase HRD1B-like isoform X1 [Homarus americanus]|uniref:ERAD-associated E3 ubiquitin-protein ligase HRD1B-like isoform X1 n=1 Tax=Homarus americanus TaxID=6706 RepID=UPI001C485BF5|nr:ERAD-associated E3 ubiquitin-protein ligase HRD1B-like isoform X1 [Homarus americanus]
MPLPSPYRNPGRWRAVVFQQEVRHGTAGCLLSVVLLAPLLVRDVGVGGVAVGVVVYSCILVPALTNYYSFPRLVIRLARALYNGWNKNGSALYTGLATSLGSAVCWAAFWTEYLVRQFLRYLLRAIFMPLIFVFGCVLPLLHNVYLAFDGFRTTSNQVVFFLMVQQLVTPLAHLTALYFLLFYTVLHYLHKSLFTRQWARTMQTTEMRDLMRLTAWYMAVRLGKGVAMSFVLVMFTLQFNHVESDLVYIVVTFIYFVVSQRRWTGNERIVSWSRALDIEVLEEEEEFWVPVFMRGSTVVASLCVTVPLALSSPWLVMMAAYTNLLVPGLLLRGEYLAHISRQSVLITKCRRATPQEIELNSTCPVCLEELRQARLTPCRHLYHAACLRKCLTLSPLCPLCKQTI